MSAKIACTACGTLILATTAAANGGLCAPCKRGIRDNIEDGKLRQAARKQAEANPDPATLHWRALVKQVDASPDGFDRLSAENQMYFAACLLEGEIYNGGFDQYFCNSSADFYPDAVRGLEEIGATECRRILLAAKQPVFGPREVPERAARLERLGKMTAAQADKLEEFDRLFTNEAASFRDRVAQYAQQHRLYDA